MLIPASVTSIGSNPFSGCTGLNAISVVDGNEVYFSNNESVLFNKAATELIAYPVGKSATYYSIPPGVIVIGDSAFVSCKSMSLT